MSEQASTPSPINPVEQPAPAVLTREDEPATRVLDPVKAEWMGHAMVANMDQSVNHRQVAQEALAGSYTVKGYEGWYSGQSKHDEHTVYAIQHEGLADVQAEHAEEAFDMSQNGQDDASRAEGAKRLDSLTRENRPAGYVKPIKESELQEFKPLLEKDAAKKQARESLLKTLDGDSGENPLSPEDNEAEFIQESQRILSESMPIRVEADKLAIIFARGSSLEANTPAAKTMEQAARSSTAILRMGLGEYFSPTRIAQWEKKGSLIHAPAEINNQLRSIALSGMLGERSGDRFVPEPLDLFNDPQGVTDALEGIIRRATGPQILAVAQKSMKLLSTLQTYESIVPPTGKNLAPLEDALKRINNFISTEDKSVQHVDRDSDREDRHGGRRPIIPEERYRGR